MFLMNTLALGVCERERRRRDTVPGTLHQGREPLFKIARTVSVGAAFNRDQYIRQDRPVSKHLSCVGELVEPHRRGVSDLQVVPYGRPLLPQCLQAEEQVQHPSPGVPPRSLCLIVLCSRPCIIRLVSVTHPSRHAGDLWTPTAGTSCGLGHGPNTASMTRHRHFIVRLSP